MLLPVEPPTVMGQLRPRGRRQGQGQQASWWRLHIQGGLTKSKLVMNKSGMIVFKETPAMEAAIFAAAAPRGSGCCLSRLPGGLTKPVLAVNKSGNIVSTEGLFMKCLGNLAGAVCVRDCCRRRLQ